MRNVLDTDRVLRLVRLNLADGRPFALVTVWCPEELGGAFTREQLTEHSFHDLLEVPLGHGVQTIAAAAASARDAELLEIAGRVAGAGLRADDLRRLRTRRVAGHLRVPRRAHRVQRRPATHARRQSRRPASAWSTEHMARDRAIERWGLAVSLMILVVTAAVRLGATSLWLDEAYSLAAVDGLGASLRATHGTMGLYYVLLWPWAHLVRSAWWMRALSVVFAAGTLFVFRPIARRVGGSRLVAVSLPLLALGALFQWKATEARAYSLEMLIATASWWVMLRALDEERPGRWWLLFGMLSVCGELSHGLYVLQLVPIGVYVVVRGRRLANLVGVGSSAVCVVGVSLYLLTAGRGQTGTYIPGGIQAWTGSTLDALLSANVALKIFLTEVLVLGIIWTVRSAWKTRGRTTSRTDPLLALLWFVLPVASLVGASLYSNSFNPRYLSPVLPALALLLGITGLGLDDWRGRSKRTPVRPRRRPGFACRAPRGSGLHRFGRHSAVRGGPLARGRERREPRRSTGRLPGVSDAVSRCPGTGASTVRSRVVDASSSVLTHGSLAAPAARQGRTLRDAAFGFRHRSKGIQLSSGLVRRGRQHRVAHHQADRRTAGVRASFRAKCVGPKYTAASSLPSSNAALVET